MTGWKNLTKWPSPCAGGDKNYVEKFVSEQGMLPIEALEIIWCLDQEKVLSYSKAFLQSWWFHARSWGVLPALVLTVLSAPAARRAVMTSTWPWADATWRGVQPSSPRMLMSSPAWINLSTTSTWPFHDARCSGVLPFFVWQLTSPPLAMSSSVRRTWPAWAAPWMSA